MREGAKMVYILTYTYLDNSVLELEHFYLESEAKTNRLKRIRFDPNCDPKRIKIKEVIFQ